MLQLRPPPTGTIARRPTCTFVHNIVLSKEYYITVVTVNVFAQRRTAKCDEPGIINPKFGAPIIDVLDTTHYSSFICQKRTNQISTMSFSEKPLSNEETNGWKKRDEDPARLSKWSSVNHAASVRYSSFFAKKSSYSNPEVDINTKSNVVPYPESPNVKIDGTFWEHGGSKLPGTEKKSITTDTMINQDKSVSSRNSHQSSNSTPKTHTSEMKSDLSIKADGESSNRPSLFRRVLLFLALLLCLVFILLIVVFVMKSKSSSQQETHAAADVVPSPTLYIPPSALRPSTKLSPPAIDPSAKPTVYPTTNPTAEPSTKNPTHKPTTRPTVVPTAKQPTGLSSTSLSASPSGTRSGLPSTSTPTSKPSSSPSTFPTKTFTPSAKE